jgi:hypothetical protein
MARDSVANVVNKLHQRGFEPHRIAADSWESRCPAHRGKDHALLISRTEQGQVVLECRSEHCVVDRILQALDLTNVRVYWNTPNWVLRKLAERPIVGALFATTASETQELPVAPLLQAEYQTPKGGEPVTSAEGDAAELELTEPEHQPSTARGFDSDGGSIDEENTADLGLKAATALAGLDAGRAGSAATSADRSSDLHVLDGLLQFAESARVFRAAEGRFFAQIEVGCRQEIYSLSSAEFRDWLIGGYLTAGGRPPSKGSIRRVIETLEARARFEQDEPTLAIRVGRAATWKGAPTYIDMGDNTGRAVVIDASGWTVLDRPPVAFRRPEGLLPLPVPSREGSINLLRPFVNLTDRDFRLLVVWLAAALRPVGPYPILTLYGEQGSAKSTLARIVRLLVDPQDAPLLIEPRSTRDMMITALNGWLLSYDNISIIRRWLSDGLCMLATGGAYAGRTEYTSLERTVFKAQRPIVLNGIDEYLRRGDLSDRAVLLQLPPIPASRRRREDELWEAFEHDQARIFGGLLDAIVLGLREQQNVKLAELPRMADFAAASEAIGRGLGWGEGTVLADYATNRLEATAALIEDSAVATALLENMYRYRMWQGTPRDLHSDLAKVASRRTTASARWPNSPVKFANELRRIAPHLRTHGLHVAFGRKHSGRFVMIGLVV